MWSEIPGPFWDLPAQAHYSRWVSTEATRFLTEARDRDTPFFLMANFHDPHHPFTAPPEYLDRFRDADFPAPIVPHEDGDKGEMLGDHALLLKGPVFYDGAVRVPLVVSWPDVVAAGGRRDDLVQTHDVFATCLAAAGLDIPPGGQSRNLLAEGGDGRGWAMCALRDDVSATMVRDDRYKIVFCHRPDQIGELYDLAEDPHELVNLWHHPGSASIRAHLTHLAVDVLVECENRSAPREGPW